MKSSRFNTALAILTILSSSLADPLPSPARQECTSTLDAPSPDCLLTAKLTPSPAFETPEQHPPGPANVPGKETTVTVTQIVPYPLVWPDVPSPLFPPHQPVTKTEISIVTASPPPPQTPTQTPFPGPVTSPSPSKTEMTKECPGCTVLTVTSTSYYPTNTPFPGVEKEVGEYDHLGCYDDTQFKGGKHVVGGENGMATSSEAMDLIPCEIFCRRSPFFGVTNGKECYCGEQVNEPATTLPVERCDIPCGGLLAGQRHACGGNGTISIYKHVRGPPGGSASSSPYTRTSTRRYRPTSVPRTKNRSAGVALRASVVWSGVSLLVVVLGQLVWVCLP
ncbi:hypothetical protein P154DRAFT_568527 [Amniculicola lignicola CBS 123094]|uniref:WSC domain-containing protein n=1 Tax=Amniculicola lignicola CBS 123094 TaxID=1392246 RepID=A0A6A5X429_9PLEO|nr:hypothetical protein P154DRAFT_568527 [Amniculicola lignicola CBS 123094]